MYSKDGGKQPGSCKIMILAGLFFSWDANAKVKVNLGSSLFFLGRLCTGPVFFSDAVAAAPAHAPAGHRPNDVADRSVRIPRCDVAQHATQFDDIDLRFDGRLPWSVRPRSHSHVVDCVFGVVNTTHSIGCRRLTFLSDLNPQCVYLPICVDSVEELAGSPSGHSYHEGGSDQCPLDPCYLKHEEKNKTRRQRARDEQA